MVIYGAIKKRKKKKRERFKKRWENRTVYSQCRRSTDGTGKIRRGTGIFSGMSCRDAIDAQRAEMIADFRYRDSSVFRCVDRYTIERPGYIHGHVALQYRARHRHEISPVGDFGIECDW